MSKDFDLHFKEFSSFLTSFTNLNQIHEGSSILKKMETDISMTKDEELKKKYKKNFFSCKNHFVNLMEDLKFNQEHSKLDITENESSLNNFVSSTNNTFSALNALNALRNKEHQKKQKGEVKLVDDTPTAIEIVRISNDYDFTGNYRRQRLIKYSIIFCLSILFVIVIILLILSIKRKSNSSQ